MIGFVGTIFIVAALLIATVASGGVALICLLAGKGRGALIWIVVALFSAACLIVTLGEVFA